MLHRFRDHFGTAGLVVAVVALVAATAGGAYAAGGGLTGKQKKEVKSIAKSFQGTGPAGAPGAAGLPGAKGDPGAGGKNGTNGKDGANGTNGTSVTGVAATVGECPAGGVKYTSASGSNAVCNGEDGETGFTETLPSTKTETGSFGGVVGEDGVTPALSFPIPLAAELDSSHVKGVALAGTAPAECENAGHAGVASAANPEAQPGFLCVFAAFDPTATASTPSIFKTSINPGASTTGAVVLAPVAEGVPYYGTFAVTAP